MADGVTATGFVVRSYETILENLQTSVKAELGAETNLEADSPLGQIVRIMALGYSELWELAQSTYSANDPATAGGKALENISALTGTYREGATKSTADVEVTVDQAVSIPAGNLIISVSGNSEARFVNTAVITFAGAGTASHPFEAEETGPTVANSGTLTVIETPITGVTGVTNPLDALIGQDIELDPVMRLRRLSELSADAVATIDAIRARVNEVTGVLDSFVIENRSENTDFDTGLPPNSVNAVVDGGADNAVAQKLWDSLAGGVQSYGQSSGIATDDNGDSQTVEFDRPTDIDIYVDYTLTVDANYPVDGDTQLKALVVATGDALLIGQDVIASKFKALAFQISGVVDVTAFGIGTAASPTAEDNIEIGLREKARFDTSRTTVTS